MGHPYRLLLMPPVINNWAVDIHYEPLYHDIKAMSGQLKMHKE